MEAQFVAPAPPKAPQQFSSRPNDSSGTSTFGPELSKALSDNHKSSDNSAASSKNQNNDKQPVDNRQQRADDIQKDIEGNEGEQAVGALPANDSAKNATADSSSGNGTSTGSDETTHTVKEGIGPQNGRPKGPSETAIANAGEKITNPVAREHSALFTFSQQHGDARTAETILQETAARLAQKGVETATENRAPLRHPVAAHLASNSAFDTQKASNPLNGSLSTGTAESATLPKDTASLAVFNGQDTFSWTRKGAPAGQTDQHGRLYSFLFNENQTASPQNNQASLSTESIMARLTQLSAENGQSPLRGKTFLRDNTPVSLRHDISGQFLQAKTEMTQAGQEGQTGQQFLESEGNLAKQQPLSSSLTKSADVQPDSSFSQALNHAADKPAQPTAETFRPTIIPFTSHQVTENDLLNQVTQRLRISNITQDTKLVMRLHPAELGNLKVDIHLKDGTVNANIVAQSQQVQEILEKNMPRLRELMEQNGLRVGEIAIHLDSDLPTDQNLFDEQLAQQNDMESGNRNSAGAGSFVLNQEEEEDGEQHQTDTSQGVNLKA